MSNYKKLKESHQVFNDLNLSEAQQTSLDSLIGYSAGSLNSLKNKITELRQDNIHSEEFKAKALKDAKASLQKTLDLEYQGVQGKLALAQQALHNATHQAKSKDTTEELLRFMQEKEIRDSLEKLPLAKRIDFVMDGVENGDATILRAVESQPITSDLIPDKDVLERANSIYAEKGAPTLVANVKQAEANFESATKIRNLTAIAMQYLEQRV